jgi:hypothetical protein
VTLANASVEQLQAEITRREAQLAALEAQRSRLVAAMASLDVTLSGLGAANSMISNNHRSGAASPNGRAHHGAGGGMSLVEAMRKVLPNAVMSVAEIGEAVKSIGYKTASRNFRTVITNALGKHTHLFKKVSRGRYTAR